MFNIKLKLYMIYYYMYSIGDTSTINVPKKIWDTFMLKMLYSLMMSVIFIFILLCIRIKCIKCYILLCYYIYILYISTDWRKLKIPINILISVHVNLVK